MLVSTKKGLKKCQYQLKEVLFAKKVNKMLVSTKNKSTLCKGESQASTTMLSQYLIIYVLMCVSYDKNDIDVH